MRSTEIRAVVQTIKMDMVTTGRHFTSSPETAEPPLNTELDELMERRSFARATSPRILVVTPDG
jgi:hypothetical protein